MYATLNELSKKYSLSPSTIKRKDLIEGIHYINIGRLVRYHIDNIHELLVTQPKTDNNINDILDTFLIEN